MALLDLISRDGLAIFGKYRRNFMKLEDIGFYTLSDKRAREVSWESDLQRCELILTNRCNFRCPYCRGVKPEYRGDISYEDAIATIDIWASGNLKAVRLSGGEPTLWPRLLDLVQYIKRYSCFEHIALSTNGSAPFALYADLVEAGVNDFSISFDSCCSSGANKMAGVDAAFERLCENIRRLSELTYVSVGVVLTEDNHVDVSRTITTAAELGVKDIRVIPSAQWNKALHIHGLEKFPILKYRSDRAEKGLHVRGIGEHDCGKCHLVKDDMVVLSGKHFPCVIYMREGGAPIGEMKGKTLAKVRMERKRWFDSHNSHTDMICRGNCLDVCIEHNNTVESYSS